MHNIMVAGAGKIGSLIACLLANSNDYQVHLADLAFDSADVKRLLQVMPEIKTIALDVKDQQSMLAYVEKHNIVGVISSLPYFLNSYVAQAAKVSRMHYFDLTEDTAITAVVKAIAEGAQSAFVPQCGLAPGFISIVANSLMQEFDQCYHTKLRVGALPQRVTNGLHYSLTWSTDGVINEYGNSCHGIEGGKDVLLTPLEGLESIQIDGCIYEAFNTSGGLGSLGELYLGKLETLNYKTMRYPGHCEKIRFLMNELKLNQDRATLKKILEQSIPKTYQDLVLIYVTVDGIHGNEFSEILNSLDNRAKKNNTAILLGIPITTETDEGSESYNGVLALGSAEGYYTKQHLVPFSEYTPSIFKTLVEWLDTPAANLTAGKSKQPLILVQKHPIATLICYEVAYPELVRQQLPDAEWIVSISDDGWFGHSLAMYQQLQISQVLSLQTGRYQVVANNDGLSSLIDDQGNITASLKAFTQGILNTTIHPAIGITPWVYWGDLPILLIAGIIILFTLSRNYIPIRTQPKVIIDIEI